MEVEYFMPNDILIAQKDIHPQLYILTAGIVVSAGKRWCTLTLLQWRHRRTSMHRLTSRIAKNVMSATTPSGTWTQAGGIESFDRLRCHVEKGTWKNAVGFERKERFQ